MFTKYQKKNNDSKVLLLYLLLNGNDMEKIKLVEEAEDSRRKVIYGVTSEAVNGRKFEQEIEAIEAPTVCSMQSYELYSDSKIIHIYTKENEFKIFYKGEKDKEFLLFSSVEIDRTATYKFVLYIISKSQEELMDGVQQDNYKITDYELVVRD